MEKQKIIDGISQVRVIYQDDGGKATECHKGIVLSHTQSFVRVFNPSPKSQDGDTAPEDCEWFPITSKRRWVEWLKERDNPFPIPALFR